MKRFVTRWLRFVFSNHLARTLAFLGIQALWIWQVVIPSYPRLAALLAFYMGPLMRLGTGALPLLLLTFACFSAASMFYAFLPFFLLTDWRERS